MCCKWGVVFLYHVCGKNEIYASYMIQNEVSNHVQSST